MNKPTIELRGIKVHASMSEETNCYEATLVVDGEVWGRVSNHGQGGPDNFHGTKGRSYSDVAELNKRIAATYPKVDISDIGISEPLTPDLELVCGEILTDHLIQKDLKRLLSRNVLKFRDGGIYPVPLKQKGKTWPMDAVTKAIRAKEPNAVLLNEMPFDQALAIFKKAA